MIKTEDFDFDNILIEEKLYENILVYNILCKTLLKQIDLLEFMREQDIYYYLVLKNIMSFTIGLDIL